MQQLTPEGQNLVNDLAYRYNLSHDTIITMIGAVNSGGGTMAQFYAPELGGGGQWMQGGMTMVGDMFNNGLKNTVDNLCSEISNALATTTIFPIAPAGTPQSNQWWPTELNLGTPFSSGGQNSTRYALFANRLAVDNNGKVTVYDTLDNNIGGVLQQQGGNDSLTFSSQYGTILVSTLPIVYGQGNMAPPQTNFASSEPMVESNLNQPQPTIEQNTSTEPKSTSVSSVSADEIVGLIEKLSQLHDAGALSQDEFMHKKSELLSRL